MAESAEAGVALLEERAHEPEQHAVRQGDVAAHRAEGVHDAPDWIWGCAPPDGPMLEVEPASSPPKKYEPESS
jgi:hypothetical protein